MNSITVLVIFLSIIVSLLDGLQTRIMMKVRSVRMSSVDKESVSFATVAVSGFASKKSNFAVPDIFDNLFRKDSVKALKVLTDDIKFARKRLVTPKNVYSGVIDVLEFEEEGLTEKSLENSDALVCFNITPTELAEYCSTLAKTKTSLKRVVFAVNCQDSNGQFSGEGVTFSESCSLLQQAGIDYTILKFGELRDMEEGKYPYRIVRDQLPLPSISSNAMIPSVQGTFPLSTSDLYRVICEVVDIPKTFNKVFGIGPGTALDAEILIYMKSQGWPERVQVTMLMGDLMESIEKKFIEEQERVKKSNELPVVKKNGDDGITLKVPNEGNKYAGFFTG